MVVDNNQVLHRVVVIRSIMIMIITMEKPKRLLYPVLHIIRIRAVRDNWLSSSYTKKTEFFFLFSLFLSFLHHIFPVVAVRLSVSLVVFFLFSRSIDNRHSRTRMYFYDAIARVHTLKKKQTKAKKKSSLFFSSPQETPGVNRKTFSLSLLRARSFFHHFIFLLSSFFLSLSV